MVPAKAVSSYFIDKASADEENDLTNLKLQKILYYAQAEHVQKFGEKLFDESIEAWRYGPVVRPVYNWLSGCGSYTITSFDVEVDDSALNVDQKAFLDFVWGGYNKYSASYLVWKTHAPDSPWTAVYESGVNNEITVPHLATVALQDGW